MRRKTSANNAEPDSWNTACCCQFIFVTLVGLILLNAANCSEAQDRFELDRFEIGTGEVVTFLGGTNMVRLQQAGFLETILTDAFAANLPKFRDLAWEADTVFRQGSVIERWRKDGFGGRDDQFKRVGTTVVIAQFGQLESMAGPDKLDEFVKAYEQLLDAAKKEATIIVLVSPPPFEKPANSLIPDRSKNNDHLSRYVEATADIANQRGLHFVNLFNNVKQNLTDNGMHIAPNSQRYIAEKIASQLGIKTRPDKLEPLRKAVVEKHRLWYDYWRPANWKLLYGDDSRRVFTRGGKDYIPFREEWQKLLPLIAQAEHRVWHIANGGEDAGDNRPEPEKLHGDPNANVKEELASFSTSAGLTVNLFASEREGLTSPLAIRWDPAGKMYVTVTTTYPHVFPGDVPNDKIIVLEDVDKDGEADKSTVFAEGLNIPTGLELGDGGVYVGQNTEILFLKDTDNDGKADVRKVLLSGFGNGDSHQTINSFVWSPGGELFFGQGDGCESRVETPWGSSNLYQAGFYRLRPRRLQMHPLLDDFMGPGNPWGVAFDGWGQIFSIDGAGGVTYLSPGQVPSNHRRRLRTIGNPGGYCGISYLDGRHLPESLHGDFVVGDYKSNRIKRFSVKSDGAGFKLDWKEPLLQSKHRNFRPVDVKIGPDGAIYIVDWYNPITCHQDDEYRNPTRDKAHGRIWRVSAKDVAPVQPPNLSATSIADTVAELASPEYWTRYQAKRALTARDPAAVAAALDNWIQTLDPKLPKYEYHLFQALGTFATIEVVRPALLNRLLNAKDPRARAYASRLVGRWHDRLEPPWQLPDQEVVRDRFEKPLELLSQRVIDEHPLVRMEAVIACSAIDSPRSIEIAAQVTDRPMDEWLDYAFKQTIRHLQRHWLPAFKRGDVSFANPKHMAAVLNETGGRDVVDSLKNLVESDDLTLKIRASAIAAILSVGDSKDLRVYGLDAKYFTRHGQYNVELHSTTLRKMIDISRLREIRPDGDIGESLNKLMKHPHPQLQANAILLAGIWKVDQAKQSVLDIAKNDSLSTSSRAAAFQSMVEMKLPQSRELLDNIATSGSSPYVRAAAIRSLVVVDPQTAAQHAAQLFTDPKATNLKHRDTLIAFLERAQGGEVLAEALQQQKLKSGTAKELLRAFFATGRANQALLTTLNKAVGLTSPTPKYDETYVKHLVKTANAHGSADSGRKLFKSLACITCHRVGGSGGEIGPDLSSIGTTLSSERITEELLWPNRQVKEGYSVIQVITVKGKVHQGYERKTKANQVGEENSDPENQDPENQDLVIEELNSKKLVTIKANDIDEKRVTGSVMPTGLTAILPHEQLVDLIKYLTELGKIY
ncbi:MAG: putative heme-binding domain-containing protein [Pirellulaceae bacterium]|jgi:putative heme-binding domain-containing protein